MAETTYAVTWIEGEGPPRSGLAELRARDLRLESAGEEVYEIPYGEVKSIRVGRERSERISDRPTVVLERERGGTIRIAGVVQFGVVAELVERLLGSRGVATVA